MSTQPQESPTDKLAQYVEKDQIDFGVGQNIATGKQCNFCLLIDFCSRSSGECHREQLDSDQEDLIQIDNLTKDFFRKLKS